MKHFHSGFSAGLLLALLAGTATGQETDPEAELQEEPSPTGTAAPPRFQSRHERDRTLLADTLMEEARSLETPEGDILVLYRPALAAQPKGTLLLAYTGEPPGQWPAHWENLRRTLPERGWHTLALALPSPDPMPVAERPTDDAEGNGEPNEEENAEGDEAQDEEADNDDPAAPETEPALPRQERIAARLDAALTLLRRQGPLNLALLVDSESAAEALEHLGPRLQVGDPGENQGRSPLADPVRGLILVNLHPHKILTEPQLLQIFALPELPVLDLFPGMDSPPRSKQRRFHQGLARRQGLSQYQAVLLPRPATPDLEDNHNFWVRRVESFLDRQLTAGRDR